VTETTDAGANMKKAIVRSAHLEWINCLAHLLNLVSKRAAEHEQVGEFLRKCRRLVCCIKHSSTMTGLLKKEIKAMNEEKKIEILCSNR
jgi:hypothetical protein